jgi:hypothetical protein
MNHPEPVRFALEKYLSMVAEYCRGLPLNTGEERREKEALPHSPVEEGGKEI